MSDEIKILSQIEKKRVALNLRVLPETVATLNQYVSYLCELAARQGLNESQITVSGLIDHYAQELVQGEGFKRWVGRNGETKRRGKRVHGLAPRAPNQRQGAETAPAGRLADRPEAETAPKTADAAADRCAARAGGSWPRSARRKVPVARNRRRGRLIMFSKGRSEIASTARRNTRVPGAGSVVRGGLVRHAVIEGDLGGSGW